MKCYKHINEEAVSMCKKCNGFVCKDCMLKPFGDILCPDCAIEAVETAAGYQKEWLTKHRNRLILGGILGGLVFFGLAKDLGLIALFIGLWLFCIPVATFMTYDALPTFYTPTTEEAHTKLVMGKFFVICIIAPISFFNSLSSRKRVQESYNGNLEWLQEAYLNYN